MLNLNKCYLVFVLSMNMIRSCLLQYSYSFKSQNNCCSVYMNKTFNGHTPNVNGLLNLDHSDTESTSAPWVILVINVNISLVGLIFFI